MKIKFKLNGKKVTFVGPPLSRLLDIVREQFHLTGSKEGCGEGECGACSVFVNQKLVNSCLVPMAHLQGADVITLEGMKKDVTVKRLQKAFIHCGGAQCGICTPGMVMAACALLKKNKKPRLAEIQEGLSGNLCRCTGYVRIFEAVEKVAKERS